LISSYEDWEMRKVAVKGLLKNSFFLIGRERRGEKGFLVFGGLTTGLTDYYNEIDPENETIF
jgi:hypothetical protein